MRVVTGEAKGRKLKGPKTKGTRPIIDRVKTALFDILAGRVQDARFLDLFAGTGSVGIEALSRGAAHATFIEMNADVVQLIRENLQITGLADRATVLLGDAFKFLQRGYLPGGKRGEQAYQGDRKGRPYYMQRRVGGAGAGNSQALVEAPYDMIYVAPPQYHEMAARALEQLDASPLLAAEGLVIIQVHPKERPGVAATPLSHLMLSDERRYGSTLLMFYEVDVKKEQATHGSTITET